MDSFQLQKMKCIWVKTKAIASRSMTMILVSQAVSLAQRKTEKA